LNVIVSINTGTCAGIDIAISHIASIHIVVVICYRSTIDVIVVIIVGNCATVDIVVGHSAALNIVISINAGVDVVAVAVNSASTGACAITGTGIVGINGAVAVASAVGIYQCLRIVAALIN
jgi:hypothetical protein